MSDPVVDPAEAVHNGNGNPEDYPALAPAIGAESKDTEAALETNSEEQPEAAAEPAAEAPSELTEAEKLAQKHQETQPALETEAQPKPEKKKNSVPAISSQTDFPALGGGKIRPPVWAPGAITNGAEAIAQSDGWKPKMVTKSAQLTFKLAAEESKSDREMKDPKTAIFWREMKKKTGTDVSAHKSGGDWNFVVTGGTEATRQRAMREIRREMARIDKEVLTVPALIRPHIIGKGGAKVQELQSKTMTNIRVPAASAADMENVEFEDEATIDITIEGDKEGRREAIALINALVTERAIKVTRQVTDCPGQYYPFVQGPFRSNIELWEKKVDKVLVPDYVYTSSATNLDPAPGPIEIIGEKRAVEEIRDEIQNLVKGLQDQGFLPMQVPKVPYALHSFFLTNKCNMMHEILKESGCAVILPSKAIDFVLVFGPPEHVSSGVTAIGKRIQGFTHSQIDITKNYKKDHARDLVRFFRARRTLADAEKKHQVLFTFPPAEALNTLERCVVNIVGKSKETVAAAQQELIMALKKYNDKCYSAVDVEPLHHKHINGKDGKGHKRIADKTGVELLLPESQEDSRIALFYSGPSTDEAEIQGSLEQAKEHILESVKGQANIVTETLHVDKALHEKIKGERGTTLNALNPGSVLIYFGVPKTAPGKPAPATNGTSEDTITLRGTPNSVSEAKRNIQSFLDATEGDASPKFVTHEFTYPAKLSGNLIGQKGANVNKLRDEYGVNVDLKEGKGEIKGIQVCVDAAWKKLQAQIKEFEDRAIVHIKVAPKLHRAIIGSEGSTVKRLEEKYHVRITFPKNNSAPNGDTEAGADAPAGKQAPDEIIVRGTKKGAEEARKDIIELAQYEDENSYEEEIKVAAGAIAFMFRNASRNIKELRETNPAVRFNIPQENKEADPASTEIIKIRGPKADVQAVAKALKAIVKTAENTTKRTVTVDKKFHRALIGSGGAALKAIVLKAGGPDDRAALARMVRFPAPNEDSNEISVQGPKSVVDGIISAIESIVSAKQSEVVETVDVAPEKHRKLIGREGAVRKELESTFGVQIDIPRQRDPAGSGVKVTGSPDAVEKAKARILELVKEPEGETVEVPRALHHAVFDATMATLRGLHVALDHAGAPKPPKPTLPKPRNPTDLPLITDDVQDTPQVRWDVQENPATEIDGTIPWILRPRGAAAEQLAKAKAEVEKAIEAAKAQAFTGYLTLPDPSKHKYVVGPGGHQVDKIRRETGCRIVVPKQGGDGEAITLVGSKEGVEKAKDIILGLVSNPGNGGEGGERRRGPRRGD